jgi:hypothetical protein
MLAHSYNPDWSLTRPVSFIIPFCLMSNVYPGILFQTPDSRYGYSIHFYLEDDGSRPLVVPEGGPLDIIPVGLHGEPPQMRRGE